MSKGRGENVESVLYINHPAAARWCVEIWLQSKFPRRKRYEEGGHRRCLDGLLEHLGLR